jgi:hypothetical protein
MGTRVYLIDLGFYGSKFTWRGKKRSGFGKLFDKLDMGFGNMQRCLKF